MKKYVLTDKRKIEIINPQLLYNIHVPYECFIEYLDYFDRSDFSFSHVVDVVMRNKEKFPQFATWLIKCGYVVEINEKPPFKIGDVITCWDKEDGVMQYYIIASVDVNKIALISLFDGMRWTDPINVESTDKIPYSVIENLIDDEEGFCEWHLDKRQTCRTITLKERE